MRKTLVVIIVIAALGLLTLYLAKNKDTNTQANQSTTQTQATTAATTVTPTSNINNQSTTNTTASFKDGTYTGNSQSNQFGNVQVSINVLGGKISNVNLLSMPDVDSRSKSISDFAGPKLISETIAKQSSGIDAISGATYTSQSYIQSLQSAIDKARS